MKSATMRTFQTVHTWSGLLAGFALFVAFYAGALTIFHDEIATWQQPPWRTPVEARLSADELIRRLWVTQPEARDDFGIILPTDSAHAVYAYWQGTHGPRFATASQLAAPSDSPPAGNLADFIYGLHDSLGIPIVGLYLMGVISLIYGLALVSGVLIHLPHLLSDLFALRLSQNLKRLWQDAHNVIGVLSLPFHLVFALTGALFCLFAIVLIAANFLAFDGKLMDAFTRAIATAPSISASQQHATMRFTSELIERARHAALATGVRGFAVDYLHYRHYGDRNAVVELRGTSQGTLGGFGTVALNGADGRLLAAHVGSAYDLNGISYATLFGLHFGSFGGYTVRWLYFILGLAGAFLFYSGNLLWIESRRKRRHIVQPRRTRIMARAILGVYLGTCLGIAGAFAATRLATSCGIDPALAQRLACYGLFGGACIYAAWRPIPKAAMELLYAVALLYAAVAAIDLLGNVDVWRAWPPGSAQVAGVDLSGLALSYGFFRLARASANRARHGDPHSVWAHRPTECLPTMPPHRRCQTGHSA